MDDSMREAYASEMSKIAKDVRQIAAQAGVKALKNNLGMNSASFPTRLLSNLNPMNHLRVARAEGARSANVASRKAALRIQQKRTADAVAKRTAAAPSTPLGQRTLGEVAPYTVAAGGAALGGYGLLKSRQQQNNSGGYQGY